MQFSPILPTAPFQPGPAIPMSPLDLSSFDNAIVYLNLVASGSDVYEPGCLIIGDGEAELRWTTGDDFLRWLGSDANLRFTADFRLGTAQC